MPGRLLAGFLPKLLAVGVDVAALAAGQHHTGHVAQERLGLLIAQVGEGIAVLIKVAPEAAALHLPTHALVMEVNRSNWSKFDENGEPILREDGKLGLIDFGAVGVIERSQRQRLTAVMLATVSEEFRAGLAAGAARVGAAGPPAASARVAAGRSGTRIVSSLSS